MKHVKPMCRRGVTAANEYQEFVCRTFEIFNALLEFFGGSSPLGQYVESKCAIPTPNTTTTTT